jgi:hypothetical protein
MVARQGDRAGEIGRVAIVEAALTPFRGGGAISPEPFARALDLFRSLGD